LPIVRKTRRRRSGIDDPHFAIRALYRGSRKTRNPTDAGLPCARCAAGIARLSHRRGRVRIARRAELGDQQAIAHAISYFYGEAASTNRRERDILGRAGGTLATTDKHELAALVARLFRLLLAPGTAAVLEGLDGIAGRTVTILSLGRGNA